MTTGFTTPFDLKEHFSFTQLLVRTAQQTHTCRGAGRPWRGGGAGNLCHGAGVHDGVVVGGSPRRERGAWSGGRPHCAGLARGRERRGPRERGRHAPGDLTVMQDPGCARVMVVALNCTGKKPVSHRTGAATAVGVVRTEDGSITMSVDGRGWSLPVSTLCTVLNSSTDKGVTVSLHLGSPGSRRRSLVS